MIEYQLDENKKYVCEPGRRGKCILTMHEERIDKAGLQRVTLATNTAACHPPQFWNLTADGLKLGDCPEFFTLHPVGNLYKLEHQNGLFIGTNLTPVSSMDFAIPMQIPRISPNGAPITITRFPEVRVPESWDPTVTLTAFCCGCLPGKPLIAKTFMVCNEEQGKNDRRCLVNDAKC